jgi:prepilin-type N-terminal cleavage/methylation domain-containing protein
MPLRARGFTLIELLVVIAIIAILSVVVVLTLNPAQILMQSRDSNRVSDMATLSNALGIYLAQGGASLGTGNVVYVSIPDPTATSTAGDQCQGLGLITLPGNYTYHCAASSTYRNIDGTGWVPVGFNSIATGAPLSQLPIDPVNTSSSRDYYTYNTDGSNYEITSSMESSKYKLGGSNDVIGSDGGTLTTVYEKGSKIGLEPLDYGDTSLIKDFSLDEGTGTIAYDYSGNNATGSWAGIATGTSGYYSAGKVGSWAGTFDGSSTYITSTWPSGLDASGAWSVSLWSYSLNGQGPFVGLWGVGPSGNYTFYYRTSAGNPCIYWVSACVEATALSVDFNQWDMWAVTRGGSQFNVFKNGLLVASGSQGGTTALTKFYVGSQGLASNTGQYFKGLIDDVRLYSRTLSAAEIAALYASGK